MDTVLEMLKIDLGITHSLRDTYFNNLISASQSELNTKGAILDLGQIDDMMLLADYTAWNYRNRTNNVPLAQNLQLRIRNRVVKGRCNSD